MKKVITKIRNRLIKIKSQVLILYTGCILAPFLICCLVFGSIILNTVERDNIYSSELTYSQTRQLISYYASGMVNAVTNLQVNTDFNRIIKANFTDYEQIDYVNDAQTLNDLLKVLKNDNEIDKAVLYVNFNTYYVNTDGIIHPVSSVEDENWYRYIKDSTDSFISLPISVTKQNKIVSFVKKYRNPTYYREYSCFIRFDTDAVALQNALGRQALKKGEIMCLVNEDGELIVSAKENGNEIDYREILTFSGLGTIETKLNGETNKVIVEKIENIDWYLVNIIPQSVFKNSFMRAYIPIILLMLAFISLGVVFLMLLSRVFLKRISLIKESLTGPENELPAPVIENKNNVNEMDELINAYNKMLQRLENLLKERERMAETVKEAELKALQEEINPHFLYNTLAMVTCFAEDGQNADVEAVVKALVSFYRQSLNHGKALMTLEEEVKTIENYVFIQRMRYGTDIRLVINIDEKNREMLLPKLTLQPIVENALIHGILKKEDKSGTITISMVISGKEREIIVANDGIGIDSDIMQRLNQGDESVTKRHYGIYNIWQRLKYYYGDECTIVFSPNLPCGTKVKIRIPNEVWVDGET